MVADSMTILNQLLMQNMTFLPDIVVFFNTNLFAYEAVALVIYL